MKQTAVEWLVEQILTEVQNYEDGDIENEWEEPFKHEYVNKYIGMIDLSEFVIKAKEMEKEQMINIFKAGHLYSGCPFGLEQYYNETFNK
jgi:orotate phosphoribosyltransferase-like protein